MQGLSSKRTDMKNIIHAVLILAISAIIAIACKHPGAEVQPQNPGTGTGTGTGGTGGGTGGPGGGGGTGGTIDTALCFQRDVLPIFKSNCTDVGCHDAADRKGGYEFTSWETIRAKDFVAFQPHQTKLWEAINREGKASGDNDEDDDDHDDDDDAEDRRMPLGRDPLTDAQKGLIYRWIMQGAPNSQCTSGCDTNQFTFAGTVQPILNANCTGCHGGTAPSAGISLSSYAGVRVVVDNNRLPGAIGHLAGYSPMPKGGGKLSDCQIRQVERWIASGAPNN